MNMEKWDVMHICRRVEGEWVYCNEKPVIEPGQRIGLSYFDPENMILEIFALDLKIELRWEKAGKPL